MTTMRNKVQLIGHFGQDPEVKSFNDGKKLAKFSLATNETYKSKKGEKITDTQWHRILAWGPTAEIVEKYCKKGHEIALEGKLNHSSYEKDGITHYVTEVIASNVQLLGKKPE